MTVSAFYIWLMSFLGAPPAETGASTPAPPPPPAATWQIPGPTDQISNGI